MINFTSFFFDKYENASVLGIWFCFSKLIRKRKNAAMWNNIPPSILITFLLFYKRFKTFSWYLTHVTIRINILYRANYNIKKIFSSKGYQYANSVYLKFCITSININNPLGKTNKAIKEMISSSLLCTFYS